MACRPSIPDFDPRHVVNLRQGEYDETTYQDLDQIFNGLAANTPQVLVVHFHGGNVPKKSGMEEAQCLYPVYRQTDAYPVFFVWESGPLEIDPGPLEVSLARKAKTISDDPIFVLVRDAVLRVLGLIGRGQLLDGAAIEAMSEADLREALRALFLGDNPFRSFEELVASNEFTEQGLGEDRLQRIRDNLLNALRAVLRENDRWRDQMGRLTAGLYTAEEIEALRRVLNRLNTDGEELPEIPARISDWSWLAPSRTELSDWDLYAIFAAAQKARGANDKRPDVNFVSEWLIGLVADVAWAVLKRCLKKRDHGLYCTVVEEVFRKLFLNGLAWVYAKIMEGAKRAFRDDPTVYGGSGFLEQLYAYRNNSKNNLRVVLVGHSGGAVYIHELLLAASQKFPMPFEVVFLAGAATFKDMKETIDDAAPLIPNFRSFGLRDQSEIDQNVCGKPGSFCDFYPRSLLYFVGGVCEPDADELIVGMERFHKKSAARYTKVERNERDTVLKFFNDRDAAVWAPTSPGTDGRRSRATTHENMPRDPETLASLQYILTNGF